MRKVRVIEIFIVLAVLLTTIFTFSGCAKYLPEGNGNDIKQALKDGGYELVFEDNFDGTEINRNVWQGLGSPTRRGAYYSDTPDVVFVENGNAVIRTYYQSTGDEIGWHTSWLEAKTNGVEGKGFSAKYGYFEARLIAPPTHGIWSAFWLMPDDGNFNWDGSTAEFGAEIDIMESAWYDKKTTDGQAQLVVHTDYTAGKGKYASHRYKVEKMHSEFHTYGVMWTPTEYIWFVDGNKVLQTKHIVGGKDYGTPKVKEYPIFSVEVGGNTGSDGKPVPADSWAGDPMKNDLTKNYDFIIDYVKVYQIPTK